jgi:transcriptional regulator with XRE-family HTH domain
MAVTLSTRTPTDNGRVRSCGHPEPMPIRMNRVDQAGRRARRQLDELVRDLRAARETAGLSQAAVGAALGRSRPLVAHWEIGHVHPGPVELARWGAVVGLDVSIRGFAAGSPLRDAGQLRLLARGRAAIGEVWTWRTEVPVSSDPSDRRAFDAVLLSPAGRIGLEAVTRLTDAQAQVRALTLKQEAAGLERMVFLLAGTHYNRVAIRDAAPTLAAAFPARPREVLRALRAGELPPANGIILV